jgi:hypothetical protein
MRIEHMLQNAANQILLNSGIEGALIRVLIMGLSKVVCCALLEKSSVELRREIINNANA